MDIMFKEKMDFYCRYVEKCLEEYVNCECNFKLAKSLNNAMLYSLSAGGKRIRPILVFEFCTLCGADFKKATACACAIEMIHTFSLIHDDLPAMDNDDMRRGKPSCHKAFGEAQAILAGDALATIPYRIIANDKDLDADIKAKLVSVLALETSNMIAGQIIDIENEKRSVDAEILNELYSGKTCALLRACCKMGAICANADDQTLKLAEKYAENLGLAFQIIDDILDVLGDEKVLGKPVGSDQIQNKTTYITLFGLENSKLKARELTKNALEILEKFENCEFLKMLTEYLLERNS